MCGSVGLMSMACASAVAEEGVLRRGIECALSAFLSLFVFYPSREGMKQNPRAEASDNL